MPVPIPAPASTPVARLEIVPGTLQVKDGITFEITVRGLDAAGHVVAITPSNPPTWDSSDPAQLTPANQTGVAALFQAKRTSGNPVTISAKLDGLTAKALLTINPVTAVPTDLIDILESDHVEKAQLDFALLNGSRGALPASVVDEFVAFGANAHVPDLAGTGTVVDFSPNRRVSILPATWDPKQQTITAPGDGVHLVQVPLLIWDATTAGLPPIPTWPDLDIAKYVYRTGRTGIEFVHDSRSAESDGTPKKLGTAIVTLSDCANPEALFPVFDPARLEVHVFIVEDIDGLIRGYACPASADASRVARAIFISRDRNSTTFAHELGHLAALLEPAWGHTDCAGGFDEANLMWRWLDDTQSGNRLELSLGQAFRIAADARSWIAVIGQGAASSAPDCSVAGNACPALPVPTPVPPGWLKPIWCP